MEKQAMDEAVERVRRFFDAGRLDAKIIEAEALLSRGDAAYFDGGFKWSIAVPEFDRLVNGQSENMAAGLGDIRAAMLLLDEDYGDEHRVEIAAIPLED